MWLGQGVAQKSFWQTVAIGGEGSVFSLVPSEEGVVPAHFSFYYQGELAGVINVLGHGVYDAIAHGDGQSVQLNQDGPVTLSEARQLLQVWATGHSRQK